MIVRWSRGIPCILGAGLIVTGCRQAPRSEPAVAIIVTASAVGREDVTAHVTLRGRLVPRSEEDITLAAQVPGRLVRVDAREGDLVPAGAVLALVDRGPRAEAERTAVAALAKAREEETVKGRAAHSTRIAAAT
jgi:multidrug efflux pump subunit AcrA (membrane-fusion protein)